MQVEHIRRTETVRIVCSDQGDGITQGYGNTEWYRMTAGFESLGKYIDWRANGYFMMGDDSVVLTDSLSGNLALSGNNVFRMRNQTRENAYSGFDIETGGHVFQLHFTNSTSMIEKGFVTETSGDWLDGGIHFGFNVSRVFTVRKPRH